MMEVESREFTDRLMVASTFGAFRRILVTQPAYEDLVDSITGSFGAFIAICGRLQLLATQDFERTYTNPNDVALAAYGLACATTYPDYSPIVASLLEHADRAPWTSQVKQMLYSYASPTVTADSKDIILDDIEVPQAVAAASADFYYPLPGIANGINAILKAA